MIEKHKIRHYIKAYQWSNIWAMMKNNAAKPAICKDDAHGKLVMITGATSGIGYVTARKYAAMGADLLCINRNVHKSEALQHELESEYGISCECLIADLSLLEEIKRVAGLLAVLPRPIDVIIHNVGVYLTRRELTADGLDKVFAVHYLSSFVINYLLMDKLRAQKECRIILVNSEGHRFAVWGIDPDDLNWDRRSYSGLKSYGSAKTAQLLSLIFFKEHFASSGVCINAMHPGAVKSSTGQENGVAYRWFKKHVVDKTLNPPEISAEALYYLGVSDEVAGVSGQFFNLTRPEEPAPPALDAEVARQLWSKSIELSQLK